MKAIQVVRLKKLVDVIAAKIQSEENLVNANSCINICGTSGCVWGDFVIKQKAVSIKTLQNQKTDIKSFGFFFFLLVL